MGRPRKAVDVDEVQRLRDAGCSWPEIARRMGLGYGTVYRAHRHDLNRLVPIQNPVSANPVSLRDDQAA